MNSITSNQDLYDFFNANNGDFNNLSDIVNKTIDAIDSNMPENKKEKFKKYFETCYCHLKHRLNNICYRNKNYFISKYKTWLKNELRFTTFSAENSLKRPAAMDQPEPSGSKLKPFTECTDRHKRRRTDPLLSRSIEELTFATERKFRLDGNIDAVNVLNYINTADSDDVRRIRSECENPTPKICMYTREKALAIYVDARLSKNQYKIIRNSAVANGCTMYPSYYGIQEAKKACYPDSTAITISETHAEIKLQALLNHTTERICRILEKSKFYKLDYANQNWLRWGIRSKSVQTKIRGYHC